MQEGGTDSGTRQDRRTWRGYVQIALLCVALAAALYFARAPSFGSLQVDSASSAGSAPPVVEVVLPTTTAQSLTVRLTGTVSLQERTTIASGLDGRIVWMSPDFVSGGSITAGETILRIDPAEYELEVAKAQAAVEAAEARVWLEETVGEGNVRTFRLANPDVEPSAWIRRLPQLALAQAELKEAQTALELAELQLARTHISLPYDVRVVTTDAAIGEWASPDSTVRSAALGVVYQTGALQIRVPIEPRDLAYLEPAVGRAVRVTDRLGVWKGAIVGVSSVVDPGSRLSSVYIEFAEGGNANPLPDPGKFVEVAIEGPPFQDVYVLPNTVPQGEGGIWVVRDGRLHMFLPEEFGRTTEGWVVKAFDAGEGVMVGSLPGAREGLEVSAHVIPDVR